MLAAYKTLFSKFMLFYYGFFGVTLFLNASVHAVDGPFPNPLAYWTTLSAESIFFARIGGLGMLILVLSPAYFDMAHSGFIKATLAVNTVIWLVFIVYSFYPPAAMATAISLVWKAQTLFAGAVVGCSVLEYNSLFELPSARDLPVFINNFAKFLAIYFGGFAVALMTIPDILFGPPSPLAYWTVWGDLAMLPARSFGFTMLAVIVCGYLWHEDRKFLKMTNIFNLIFIPFFIQPAFYGGESAVAWIWQAQLALQIPIALINLHLEYMGRLADWGSLKFSCPACGLNVETFLMVNLFFYLPFVLAFLTDPNAMFGPSAPSGMPMFTEDMNETALWFGRSWAVGTLLVVLGPYLFGFAPIKVAKQLLILYASSVPLFVYYLMTSTIFNPTMVIPMTLLNVFFLAWNAYLVYQSTSQGEPLL